MRGLLAGLLVLGWACAPSAVAASVEAEQPAAGVDDPRAFVESVYADYAVEANGGPPEPAHAYSARLRRLIADYEAVYAGGDLLGPIDFDLWTNSQDWSVSNLTLAEEQDGPDRRTIVARFRNWDTETVNRYLFVREGGRWYLDDIVNGAGGGEDGWTFSALLTERP